MKLYIKWIIVVERDAMVIRAAEVQKLKCQKIRDSGAQDGYHLIHLSPFLQMEDALFIEMDSTE